MPTKDVRLREDHHRFVQDEALSLSGLVQNGIDEVKSGDRELPTEADRETEGHDLIRTSVSLTDEHDDFVGSREFVFSVFVHQLIEERIKREQLLQHIQDGDI
ncbi:hypothetical protein U4E84_03255 [Halorubrum sp. AD140]|uniref:hypothetical protein n=1 Tax=Halorubrum sp. AD140 TaxID=3050073 RepID=UPI002ACC9D25|nr:hypothetical protein [Halorubrum sp. AD140]MDZ5810371.1 hypothetical protein [Halorubrum sp. AD140]